MLELEKIDEKFEEQLTMCNRRQTDPLSAIKPQSETHSPFLHIFNTLNSSNEEDMGLVSSKPKEKRFAAIRSGFKVTASSSQEAGSIDRVGLNFQKIAGGNNSWSAQICD